MPPLPLTRHLARTLTRPLTGPSPRRDHHLTATRFNCCYGNIGWLDALHGTSKMYFDACRAKSAARDEAQRLWEAARDKLVLENIAAATAVTPTAAAAVAGKARRRASPARRTQ